MLVIIKVKTAIDLMPLQEKKEDFLDKQLNDFFKLPLEDQREDLISEQERILFALNLNNKYLNHTDTEKNIIRMYKFQNSGQKVFSRNFVMLNSCRNGVNIHQNLERFYYCKRF